MRILISLLFVFTTTIAFCDNGVEMIMSHKQFKENGVSIKAEKTSTIWILENMMKITSSDEQEPILIFNSETEEITLVMRNKREYMTISKSELEEINSQLEEARLMMEQQLSQMPASQKAMVKEKMGNMFSQNVPKIEYNLVEEDVEVGPYYANKYQGTVDNSKKEEVYLASIEQFEVESHHFEVFSKMMKFMQENLSNMMSSLGGESSSGSLSNSYPSMSEAIPVRSISFEEEIIRSREELIELTSKEIPNEAFYVPAGYKEIDFQKQMNSNR